MTYYYYNKIRYYEDNFYDMTRLSELTHTCIIIDSSSGQNLFKVKLVLTSQGFGTYILTCVHLILNGEHEL